MLSTAQAGSLDLTEPDWRERFEEHCRRWPEHVRENFAFEAVMTDWRRFHATLLDDGKHRPAGATEAIIALAQLRIFPPRSGLRDLPRDGKCLEPDVGDDHIWLQIAGRAWRIVAIEDRILILDSFGEGKQIDLGRAKWGPYVEAATAALA